MNKLFIINNNNNIIIINEMNTRQFNRFILVVSIAYLGSD